MKPFPTANETLSAAIDKIKSNIVLLVSNKNHDKDFNRYLKLDIFFAYYTIRGLMDIYGDEINEDVRYGYWELTPLLQNIDFDSIKNKLLIQIRKYEKTKQRCLKSYVLKVL